MHTEATPHTTESLTVRLSPADKGRVDALARRVRGVRPSALARELLLVALSAAERDPAAMLVNGRDA